MKQKIIEAFIAHFTAELSALIASAKAAHAAATHEESRAEDRHDTFAIEASYLAAGQAKRVQEIRASLSELNDFLSHLQAKTPTTAEVGEVVVLECQGKHTYALIAQFGGGAQIELPDWAVSIVSPTSPLGENILGLQKDDVFAVESRAGTRSFRIVQLI